ncbi:hypothetical protein LshimejAT787_1800480 [Lyophyllum shimeji]|uniref:Uncharacterized protein n=1 Tax=Lyophyllum shimeji TaxID=47721 RepID=A0A9P3UW26_LYOSH|nr:hypothetical protein LshimejAT787_1800480 [Lyophyllum shimeji]
MYRSPKVGTVSPESISHRGSVRWSTSKALYCTQSNLARISLHDGGEDPSRGWSILKISPSIFFDDSHTSSSILRRALLVPVLFLGHRRRAYPCLWTCLRIYEGLPRCAPRHDSSEMRLVPGMRTPSRDLPDSQDEAFLVRPVLIEPLHGLGPIYPAPTLRQALNLCCFNFETGSRRLGTAVLTPQAVFEGQYDAPPGMRCAPLPSQARPCVGARRITNGPRRSADRLGSPILHYSLYAPLGTIRLRHRSAACRGMERGTGEIQLSMRAVANRRGELSRSRHVFLTHFSPVCFCVRA